mmetsp:Transcript_2183/g.4674  ORF Transcript_2183/g.4674 Transcript_2183/m.4674 type:complete len:115 (+) Transcript_2183:237-581(+)
MALIATGTAGSGLDVHQMRRELLSYRKGKVMSEDYAMSARVSISPARSSSLSFQVKPRSVNRQESTRTTVGMNNIDIMHNHLINCQKENLFGEEHRIQPKNVTTDVKSRAYRLR